MESTATSSAPSTSTIDLVDRTGAAGG